MGLHWSSWPVFLSLVAPSLSCPGVVGASPLLWCRARVVAVVVTVAAVTTRPAHTLLCSSWHRRCWGNLSLGHWLCPAPAVEPLRCCHHSMLEEFGLL